MARTRKEKQPKTTIQKYKFWRNWEVGLEAGKYAMPLIPFGVVLGINWSDWVGNSPSEGWSIGMGFGMLIVSVISAIIGLWKRDDIAKQKVSGVFYVAIVFAMIGFGFKLLASIANTFGDMFLYVCLGIIASAVTDQVDKSVINPKVKFYKQLVEDNGLSKASAKKNDEKEQAELEGKKAKEERMRRATE